MFMPRNRRTERQGEGKKKKQDREGDAIILRQKERKCGDRERVLRLRQTPPVSYWG